MNTSIPVNHKQPASGSPASWQTIFWILVALSINAMAQPGGRICGLPSHYRTYLRCSPFICAADMLSIIMRLLVFTLYQRLPTREALGVLLHERFNSSDYIWGQRRRSHNLQAPPTNSEGDEADGVQSLERMTWLRWLWFFLGTLPPGIKLASMRGVGWTKAWGIMLLASWVMNELLIIFATFNQSFFTISRDGQISWPGYEHTTRSLNFQKVQLSLSRLEAGILGTALILHVTMLNTVFRILWAFLEITYYPLSAGVKMRDYAHPGYISIVSIGVWIGVGLVGFLFRNRDINLMWIFLSALPSIMLSSSAANAIVYQRSSLCSGYIWVVATMTISIFLWLASLLCRRFVMLGRNLLLLYRTGHEGQFHIDYAACLCLVFFFSTLIATLFWYGHMYDSYGTTVPVWTGVFG